MVGSIRTDERTSELARQQESRRNTGGFDQVIMIMPNVTDLECFDLLAGGIIPEVERIPVAGR